MEDPRVTAEQVAQAGRGDRVNALRSASRRPVTASSLVWVNPPEPDRVREVPWLEPYPDVLLDQAADAEAGPEARYERSEAISLAFIQRHRRDREPADRGRLALHATAPPRVPRPAFGIYVKDPHAPVFHANGLMVVTLTGNLASALTRFDNSTLPRLGLPRTLPT
jgi:hypothetical protein